jgi:hypothetical protein
MLDFHQMAAFTAEDLVLINPARISGLEPTARAILFHELVHVHQYRALGLETFMHEYIASVVAYRNYRTIPLEGVAYHITHAHSAEADVARASRQSRARRTRRRSRATLGPLRRLARRVIRSRQEPVRDHMPMMAGATQVHPNEPARRDERAVVAPTFEVVVRSVATLLPLIHRDCTSVYGL